MQQRILRGLEPGPGRRARLLKIRAEGPPGGAQDTAGGGRKPQCTDVFVQNVLSAAVLLAHGP
eukprot:8429023-Alexandrium_andersonii.AAC.1